jgi:dihydroorotate dehydrogenase
VLSTHRVFYRLLRAWMFRRWDAQSAHDYSLRWLAWCDQHTNVQPLVQVIHRSAFACHPVAIGGLELPHPAILAAGFVKGMGFANEADALVAVERGENIIPGWRTMPNLVGAVEFGSFTRHPRVGNSGSVMWRDTNTQSTQNRVGLRNPGARAAAAFLSGKTLPALFGINIAVSPELDDSLQEKQELLEAVEIFLEAGIRPAWFTLNLSCPNTDDDPHSHQTASEAELMCDALMSLLKPSAIPLWVKLGPDLSDHQYERLMSVFAKVGVQAVIATNTLAQPTPDTSLIGGVGGGRLHADALRVVSRLADIRQRGSMPVAIIACGGVQDQASYQRVVAAGACVVQYYSGMIFRGPLVAAGFIGHRKGASLETRNR